MLSGAALGVAVSEPAGAVVAEAWGDTLIEMEARTGTSLYIFVHPAALYANRPYLANRRAYLSHTRPILLCDSTPSGLPHICTLCTVSTLGVPTPHPLYPGLPRRIAAARRERLRLHSIRARGEVSPGDHASRRPRAVHADRARLGSDGCWHLAGRRRAFVFGARAAPCLPPPRGQGL